jgi:hypothetical protein
MPQQNGRIWISRVDGPVVLVGMLNCQPPLTVEETWVNLFLYVRYIIVRHGVKISVSSSQAWSAICYN